MGIRGSEHRREGLGMGSKYDGVNDKFSKFLAAVLSAHAAKSGWQGCHCSEGVEKNVPPSTEAGTEKIL